MQHTVHQKLISELEAKVKEGPPAEGFVEPYFKTAWALIKKIGPSFKETHYPKLPLRDAAWTRFQGATEAIKVQQKTWETESAKRRDALLARIEEARLPGFSMAQLLDPKPEEKEKEEVTAVGADGKPLSARARRRAELEACSAAALVALTEFNEGKCRLSHAHFKIVSTQLREVRQQVEKAWETFKEEGSLSREERQQLRAKPNSPWRKKQEWFRRKLTDSIESDEACLSTKRQSLASFKKTLAVTTDEKERKRIQGWIKDAEAMIVEVETTLREQRAKLGTVEKQLAPEEGGAKGKE